MFTENGIVHPLPVFYDMYYIVQCKLILFFFFLQLIP